MQSILDPTLKSQLEFKEKYELSSSCIAGGALYKGIGKYLGMEVKDSEKFTADENTDLDGKFSLAVSELKKNDFVFLHIKGCDPLSHDGKLDEKRKFIEKIDKKLDFIFDLEDTLTVITSDHSTPCVLKSHSSDPVPVLFYGWERKNCKEFHETCSDFLINHIDVMPIILGIIGKAKM
ncbi:MAG: phosphoglycerate mutase, partial [Candidatus Micrarchaeia archaeon]